MKLAVRVTCLVVALAWVSPVWPQETAPRTKWWDSPQTQAALHLTRDQVMRIDTIFESTLPQRQALRRQLDSVEAEEEALLAQATLDDGAAMRVIERVESARARRNAARAMLLYRIRKLLTPDQRRWFNQRIASHAPDPK